MVFVEPKRRLEREYSTLAEPSLTWAPPTAISSPWISPLLKPKETLPSLAAGSFFWRAWRTTLVWTLELRATKRPTTNTTTTRPTKIRNHFSGFFITPFYPSGKAATRET